MSLSCRNCKSALSLPPGLDPARCRCPVCGVVSPLAAPAPQPQPQQQAPLNNDPLDLAALEASAPVLPHYAPGPMYAPQRPSMGMRDYLRQAGQFYRRRKRLFGLLILLLTPPALCVVMIIGGAIAIKSYSDYRTAKYASLNTRLDQFVSAGGVRETLPTAGGYIRGKYVIIDKKNGVIHSYHDGSDPRMAWKAEEVGTVIWLKSGTISDGYYVAKEELNKPEMFQKKKQAYKEIVVGMVVDLSERRVVGGFRLEAKPTPDEIGRFESATSYVDKDAVMSRIRNLQSLNEPAS
ncbi:MAG: hypothetical protein RIC55_35670 [Pirellulaceae bacterium]